MADCCTVSANADELLIRGLMKFNAPLATVCYSQVIAWKLLEYNLVNVFKQQLGVSKGVPWANSAVCHRTGFLEFDIVDSYKGFHFIRTSKHSRAFLCCSFNIKSETETSDHKMWCDYVEPFENLVCNKVESGETFLKSTLLIVACAIKCWHFHRYGRVVESYEGSKPLGTRTQIITVPEINRVSIVPSTWNLIEVCICCIDISCLTFAQIIVKMRAYIQRDKKDCNG